MAWAIAFLNAGWTHQWIVWKKFVEDILKKNFQSFLSFPNVRLMAGGFNLATDYMYLTFSFLVFGFSILLPGRYIRV
jgi:hypothetical protein